MSTLAEVFVPGPDGRATPTRAARLPDWGEANRPADGPGEGEVP